MSKVPNITLNNGTAIPALGLGTWQAVPGNGDEIYRAVKDAVAIGYRHFDCAHLYQNEPAIGNALYEKTKDGTVKREELFIVTKLWNTHHDPASVQQMLELQLTNLRLDYVDLYLMHYPYGFQESKEFFPVDAVTSKVKFSDFDYLETWKAMEDLQRKGLARALGVSNFNSAQLQRLLDEATIKPVTNQVECHPYLLQNRLRNFGIKHGVVLTSYSPLGSPERPWRQPTDLHLLTNPAIDKLAKKYRKTPAQILLRFNLQLGNVVLVKSVNRKRLEENFDVFGWELSGEEVKELEGLDCGVRYFPALESAEHRFYPF